MTPALRCTRCAGPCADADFPRCMPCRVAEAHAKAAPSALPQVAIVLPCPACERTDSACRYCGAPCTVECQCPDPEYQDARGVGCCAACGYCGACS